jgi:hypothetical protein
MTHPRDRWCRESEIEEIKAVGGLLCESCLTNIGREEGVSDATKIP